MTQVIELTQGYVALVYDEDYARIVREGSWCASVQPRTVYALRGIARPGGGRTTLPLHRFITGWKLTDHINGNGLDNRRSNLRKATKAQNTMNGQLRHDSRSGFRGVSFTKNTGRWRAYITADRVNRGRTHLGYFDTAQEAARAYDAAALIHHGEFARLNFPTGDNHE